MILSRCSKCLFLLLLLAGTGNGFILPHSSNHQTALLPFTTTSMNYPQRRQPNIVRDISSPTRVSFNWRIAQATNHNGANTSTHDDVVGVPIHPKLVATFGFLSALAWILISVKALSYHPDPKFADCTMRHNILTMSQAFAFPLPVWASVSTSLSSDDTSVSNPCNLAIMIASLWLAGACLFPPKFAFGYDLYSLPMKLGAGFVHLTTAILAFLSFAKPLPAQRTYVLRSFFSRRSTRLLSSVWGWCTIGFFWFTILPILAPYPMATIPTILGKRLSRPASGFTFLASVAAYCQTNNANKSKDDGRKILRKGLFIGSFLHLTLLVLKLIGVDGGGFLLPGRGLWEVYPAMLAVPFATVSSMALHLLTCYAALGDGMREDRGKVLAKKDQI